MNVKNPLYETKKPALSRDWLKAMLPKVGDRRMERPTINETTSSIGSIQQNDPEPCVVVLVHPGHLWYMVQFENGFRECYKVPEYVTDREWRNND